MITLMKIFRVAAPVVGLLLLLMTFCKLVQPTTLPRGFHIPGILLELVENEDEVTAVTEGNDGKKIEKIRKDLRSDSLIFIPLYTFLFFVIGLWLMGRDVPFAFVLGVATCIGILVMAAFDLLENARISEVIRASSPQIVEGIRHAALVKWGILFGLVLIVSYPFLRAGGWLLMFGILYLITSTVGLLGVFWHRPLIEWGFMLVGLSILITGEAVRHIPARA